jgi:uncharacterized protein
MECPVCKTTQLLLSERQGIEIDYCPRCRGVWLDRGELDKLIERSQAELSPPMQGRPASGRGYSHEYSESRGYSEPRDYKKRKRKSLWSEIFDF